MKRIVVIFIQFYQFFISPILRSLFGDTCRYSPSCSEYAKIVITKYGLIKGGSRALRRLLSCQPFARPNKDLIQP